VKALQKKVRDLTNDSRAKKTRIEDLENQLKQSQATVATKQEEVAKEAKKVKLLEEDL
jgi:uncharacterized protein YlxW (UPF0749 family)